MDTLSARPVTSKIWIPVLTRKNGVVIFPCVEYHNLFREKAYAIAFRPDRYCFSRSNFLEIREQLSWFGIQLPHNVTAVAVSHWQNSVYVCFDDSPERYDAKYYYLSEQHPEVYKRICRYFDNVSPAPYMRRTMP